MDHMTLSIEPHIYCDCKIRAEAKSEGSLLPDGHPAVKLVKRIGTRIAAKASDDAGVSGHMEHMKVCASQIRHAGPLHAFHTHVCMPMFLLGLTNGIV